MRSAAIVWAFVCGFAPFIVSIALCVLFSHAPKAPPGPDATEQFLYRACIDPAFGGNDERSTECREYQSYHALAQQY